MIETKHKKLVYGRQSTLDKQIETYKEKGYRLYRRITDYWKTVRKCISRNLNGHDADLPRYSIRSGLSDRESGGDTWNEQEMAP